MTRREQTLPTLDSHKVISSIEEKVSQLRKSKVIEELRQLVEGEVGKISKVRCLALGSISQETLLQYQYLCLLLVCEMVNGALVDAEIAATASTSTVSGGDGTADAAADGTAGRDFNARSANAHPAIPVSLYDPLFNSTDISIFNHYHHSVSESYPDSDPLTFYYMPHIPVEILESVIITNQPHLMFTNNIEIYSHKWTDSDLYSKFPNIALIRHSTTTKTTDSILDEENGFQLQQSRRSKRKNRNKYVPVPIEYDYSESYFKSFKAYGLESSKDLGQIYGTAFSDMALYVMDGEHSQIENSSS